MQKRPWFIDVIWKWDNNPYKWTNVPPVPLNVLTTSWPFAMWGIDMIREIRPTASNGAAIGKLEIFSRSLLSHSNLSLHFVGFVILKQFKLLKPCVLPKAQWSICKDYYLISIWHQWIMEIFAYKLCAHCFYFYIFISLKDSYTLTHTDTHSADLHPFGIPWVTVLLWLSVTMKI